MTYAKVVAFIYDFRHRAGKIMSKVASIDVLSKIVADLERLDKADRARIIKAVRGYFELGGAEAGGDEDSDNPAPTLRKAKSGSESAATFFDRKQPKTKLEELAVAARYREESVNADVSSQEQIKAVFDEARRHFDGGNFRRDIENARGRGLFLRATARNEFRLSATGQKIVDALPDRKAARELGGGRKRPKGKRPKG